jgi:hypothetical protein
MAAEAMRDVTDARQQALLQACVATDAGLNRWVGRTTLSVIVDTMVYYSYHVDSY